jgi:hypothetical protein
VVSLRGVAVVAFGMHAFIGIVVLAAPVAGALGLVWAIGAYSIAFGILLLGCPR